MITKSKLLLLCVVMHFFVFGFSQTEYPNLKYLNGSIKSIRETVYSVPKSGNTSQLTISDIHYHFNKSGSISKIYNYRNDTVFSYIAYFYDASNKLMNRIEYNADHSIYLKAKYTCDEDGTIHKEELNRDYQKSYDDHRQSINVEYDTYYQNLYTAVKYKSDPKDNIIEKQFFSKDNILLSRFLYKYDYRHNLVEVKFYNNSGKLSWRKKTRYSPKNQKNSTKFFKSNRIALLSTYKYSFDAYENWILQTETRTVYENFFADNISDNTLTTKRKIEYW